MVPVRGNREQPKATEEEEKTTTKKQKLNTHKETQNQKIKKEKLHFHKKKRKKQKNSTTKDYKTNKKRKRKKKNKKKKTHFRNSRWKKEEKKEEPSYVPTNLVTQNLQLLKIRKERSAPAKQKKRTEGGPVVLNHGFTAGRMWEPDLPHKGNRIETFKRFGIRGASDRSSLAIPLELRHKLRKRER